MIEYKRHVELLSSTGRVEGTGYSLGIVPTASAGTSVVVETECSEGQDAVQLRLWPIANCRFPRLVH